MNITKDNIIIRVANENDAEDMLEFLRKYYFTEEPITLGNEPKQQSPEDEDFHISLLSIGASIIAIDSDRNGQIVGAVLAGPVEPTEADDMLDEAKSCKDKKWSEILCLLAHLDIQANIYERYSVDRALHVHALAVHSRTRGQSIGRRMMEKCMENGKKLGYPLLCADCSSVYSIRMAEKLHMDCIGSLAYEDYRDDNGRQVFRPPHPHTHIKTFAIIL
ncbi:hypothetical protein HA402_000578 [Bradysia odoriphaga]|nr:hypothetical protein HA402_000578 [Bradysia odoriphaga]